MFNIFYLLIFNIYSSSLIVGTSIGFIWTLFSLISNTFSFSLKNIRTISLIKHKDAPIKNIIKKDWLLLEKNSIKIGPNKLKMPTDIPVIPYNSGPI